MKHPYMRKNITVFVVITAPLLIPMVMAPLENFNEIVDVEKSEFSVFYRLLHKFWISGC